MVCCLFVCFDIISDVVGELALGIVDEPRLEQFGDGTAKFLGMFLNDLV